ncbi:hypothetical protein BDR06DRAFT_967895 [Suillus hirtellus]|nr:hypothetical protein BDR06DRAFT_967895 [Suillus hirtellus]
MAAAKATHTLPDPNFNMSQCSVSGSNTHHTTTTTTTTSIRHPILLSTTSTIMVLSDTNFCKNLDPALQPTGPPGMESEQSDMAKDDSSGLDESSRDEEMGWGEVCGHHSTHPSFLEEELSPQSRVVVTLPTNHKFQYSCNKGDQVAENTLAIGSDLSEESSDDATTMDQENTPKVKDKQKWQSKSKWKSKVVDGSKSDGEGPKATQLGWYSSCCKSFFEDVKVECHTQQVLENPFPSLVDDLLVSITELLLASLVQWLKSGQ